MKGKLIFFLSLISFFLIVSFFKPLQKNRSSGPERVIVDLEVSPEEPGNEEEEIRFSPPSLTLESIFAQDHSWAATLSAQRLTSLVVTGDVLPARTVNYQAVSRRGFLWAFEEIAEILKAADLTFINLESPLIPNCPLTNEGMIFCGDPGHLEGLLSAGVDIAGLVNNHIGNHGQAGVEETLNLLASKGIASAGLSNPVIKEFGGKRLAFLAFNDVDNQPLVNAADQRTITKTISEVRDEVNIVVVMFHWGEEYTNMPTAKQRELAHLSIEAGADLVLGNHPHWIQPLEIYQDRLIVYSHGNTIFDQMWSQKTKEGIIGRYLFYDDSLIDVELLPIEIRDYGQPFFLESDPKKRILEELASLSEKLAK